MSEKWEIRDKDRSRKKWNDEVTDDIRALRERNWTEIIGPPRAVPNERRQLSTLHVSRP